MCVPDHLTKAPVYTLTENATEAEARAMILQAMKDQLTFPWTPAEDAMLLYMQLGNKRDTKFLAANAYAGMPYAGGGTGLLQALDFYDFESGVMSGLPWDNINAVFGNTCATAVNWALSVVCPAICGTTTSSVTPAFGYVPIGGITIPSDVTTFDNDAHSTVKYVENMDEQTLFKAYAAMLPADVFITVGSPNQGPHAMMCYEPAIVVRHPDGSINPEQSFSVIIDQWAAEKDYEINGNHYSMRGRIGARYSFKALRHKHFLPLRAVDLAGWQGSVPTRSKLDRKASTLSELREARIVSNYRLARVTVSVRDENGKVVIEKKNIVNQSNFREMKDRNYAISDLIPDDAVLKNTLEPGKPYIITVKSLLATGEAFLVAEIPFRIEKDLNKS